MDKKPPTPKPPENLPDASHESGSQSLERIYPEGSIISIDPSRREVLIVHKGYVSEEVDVVTDKGVLSCEAGNIEPGEYFNELALFGLDCEPDVRVRLRAKCRTVVVSLHISRLQKLTQRMPPEDQRELYQIFGQMIRANARRNSRLHRINAHNGLRAESEAAKRRSAETFSESLRVELEEAQKAPTVTPDQMKLLCEVGQFRQELKTAHNREQGLRDELRKLRSQIKAQKTKLELTAIDVRENKDLRKQLSDQSRWIEQNCPDLPAVRAIQGLANGPSDEELDEIFAKAFKPVAKPPPLPIASARPAGKTATVIAADKPFKPEPAGKTADGDCEVIGDDELWPAGATELIELGPVGDDPTVFVEEISSSILRATLPFEREAGDPQPPPVNIPAMPLLPVGLAPVGSEVVQVTKAQDVSALRRQPTAEADEDDWRDSYNGDDVWNPDLLPRKEK